MKEIIDFMNANPTGSLATIENGKPRVRPWMFKLEQDDKLYFSTDNTKDVYRQLAALPYIEFTSISPDAVWIRLRGEIKFSNDLSIKEKIIENHEPSKMMYQSADNPIFEIFYLEHGTAVFYDFSGRPPKEIIF